VSNWRESKRVLEHWPLPSNIFSAQCSSIPTPKDQSIHSDWVHIGISCSPIQPNRILRNKPPDLRIVIPKRVVVQPRLIVKVLPLKPQVWLLLLLLFIFDLLNADHWSITARPIYIQTTLPQPFFAHHL
jgi:hypothetical protein